MEAEEAPQTARGKRVPGGEIKSTPNNISWFRVRPFQATFYTKGFHLNFLYNLIGAGMRDSCGKNVSRGRPRRRKPRRLPRPPAESECLEWIQVHQITFFGSGL